MKLKTKQLMILLLAHFLIYPVYFDGVNKILQQLVIFGSIAIYIFWNFNNIRPLYQSIVNHKRTAILSIIFITIITSASFIIPILYNTNDFSYFSHIISTLIYIIFYIILVGMIRKHFFESSAKIKTLEIISLVQRNYVLITFLFLLFPSLKMTWANFITMTLRESQLIQDPSYITRISWDGYAGFTSTVYSTIAVIISIYLIVGYYKTHKKVNKKNLFNLFVALIGNSFYGRAGLLVSLIMIAIGVLYLVVFYKQYKLFYSIIGTIIILFLLVTLISNFNDTVASWYNWAMEPIISLFETGEIQTRSTDILWDMWFVPDMKTILIGDGYYISPMNAGYYMGTDVGFLRPILFFGSFFAALYYLVPFVIGIDLASNDRESKLLVGMMFISIIIFEVKGEVILKFLPILIMIFVASHVKKPKKIKSYYPEKIEIGVTINEYNVDRN